MRFYNTFAVLLLCVVSLARSAHGKAESTIDFNRDIRPILAENCFYCHGSDEAKRKGKLHLDTAEGAYAKVIVPGKPESSEVVRRIFSTDPDEQMPPPTSNRHLSDEQKKTLRNWIVAGAKYDSHWAFKTPVRPTLPEVKNGKWPRNEIDRFILAKLEANKLKPMPEAALAKQLRRVSLDLTGIPPSTDQMKRWLSAKDGYSMAVDELLASPRFGERMASEWMDIARYADTHGFNNDSLRSMWPWRDWVINAFNRNLPYDKFITEQLAGDLLPKPTLDQLVATGFNRNHVINSEGGIIDEEYRVEYVSDRVRTTSLAWLGLTMECSKCHDHKFDPIKQTDYYKMFAFFNSVNELGEAGRIANAAPFIPALTAAQQEEKKTLERAMLETEVELGASLVNCVQKSTETPRTNTAPLVIRTFTLTNAEPVVKFEAIDKGAISNAVGGKPFVIRGNVIATNGPLDSFGIVFDGNSDLKTDALPKGDGKWAISTWVRRDEAAEAPIFSTMNYHFPPSSQQYGQGIEVRIGKTGKIEVRIARRWPGYSANIVTRDSISSYFWHHLLVTCDGSEKAKGLRVFIDGEEAYRDVLQDDFATCGLSGDAIIGGSTEKGAAKFHGALADFRVWIKWNDLDRLIAESRRVVVDEERKEFNAPRSPIVFTSSNEIPRIKIESDPDNTLELAAYNAFEATKDSKIAQGLERWRTTRSKLLQIERDAPTTMIMRELPTPRETHVLFRGQYDQPRAKVDPDVPAFLPPLPTGAPHNRLGLAQWFTDPNNPLTARVVVNRFWQTIFGTGIVKTSEDFGFQAEYPSHPELLDWLAREFIERGWDVKHMMRLMVMSAAYRQDSRSTPELNERDPENRLLAHGPRQRLSAEMLRDQVLALSGLLKEKIGGPPVYPYQPANLYQGIVVAASYPGTTYTDGKGDDLYRRSLYTFWKRTVPHPTLATFDAPDREVCVGRRLKTNTPLQALALMNDTIQLEAARKLAERMLDEGGKKPEEQIRFAFQLATARKPQSSEQKSLLTLLQSRLAFYRGDKEAAKKFISVGSSSRNDKIDVSQLAAYANVASVILNLDETITRN